MSPEENSLEDHVQRAYEKACLEKDYEIAEYLLRALETLSIRDGNESDLNLPHLMSADSRGKNH